MRRTLLIILAALLLFSGCEAKTGGDTYQGSDMQFKSEAELSAFLKDDEKTAAFEKENLPVFGYYYRLKQMPYTCSQMLIDYSEDSTAIEYYTDDAEFKKENGDAYFARLVWLRDTAQAEQNLQDAIESGEIPGEAQKKSGKKTIYYGEAEFPPDEEQNLPATMASAYYFIQDGFFFSVNFNFKHTEKNFNTCNLEKVQVK